jgi:hypothetical protein
MKYLYGPGPGRKPYVSEFEQFINGYMEQHPDARRDQELGWRIWWERPVDVASLDRERHAELKPTVYHSYYYE